MRPLVSPVVEYRMMGMAQLVGGVVLALVALAVETPAVVAASVLVTGGLFGTAMYLLVSRRFARRAVEAAAAVPTADRESAARRRRRVALTTIPLLLFLALVAALFAVPAPVGGMAAGQGAALMQTSRWLRSWEREHGSRLLREPRWRWSREGRWGWGRGRGTMDPQDFYVVASGPAEARG